MPTYSILTSKWHARWVQVSSSGERRRIPLLRLAGDDVGGSIGRFGGVQGRAMITPSGLPCDDQIALTCGDKALEICSKACSDSWTRQLVTTPKRSGIRASCGPSIKSYCAVHHGLCRTKRDSQPTRSRRGARVAERGVPPRGMQTPSRPSRWSAMRHQLNTPSAGSTSIPTKTSTADVWPPCRCMDSSAPSRGRRAWARSPCWSTTSADWSTTTAGPTTSGRCRVSCRSNSLRRVLPSSPVTPTQRSWALPGPWAPSPLPDSESVT